MNSVENFRLLLRYDNWANRKVVDSLMPVAEGASRAVWTLGHLAATQRNLYARVMGEPMPHDRFPDFTVDDSVEVISQAYDFWMKWLESESEETLDREIIFVTSTGTDIKSTARIIFTQMILHGQYHRGQIANFVRQAGGKPAATDFLIFDEL